MEKEYETIPTPSGTGEAPLADLPEQEEFDISQFDFTVRDPGEDPSAKPRGEIPPASSVPGDPEPERPEKRKKERVRKEPQAQKTPGAPEEKRSFFGLPDFTSMDREMLLRKGRRYLRYALRPSGLYENFGGSLWWLFLVGACLFGGLFYLTVGMDWAHAGLISAGRMWAFVLTGLLVGGTATLAFALGTALTARLCREDAVDPFRMISAVAGAAVYPAAVLGIGILLGLFGLSVSMSFGMIALLWWIFSLMEVLRDLMGNRFVPILTWIILWGFSLFALISVTFSLK